MVKFQNSSMKERSSGGKNIQKGILFLLFFLTAFILGCEQNDAKEQNTDSDSTDLDLVDLDTVDYDANPDDADLYILDMESTDLDIEDSDIVDLYDEDSEEDIDISDEDIEVQDINVDLGLAAPFAIASAAGIENTGATHINGDVVLDPDYSCNDVPSDNAGGFGLCGGFPPTISGGEVITNLYPDTVTSAAIIADLKAAYLSIMKAKLPGATVLGCETIGSQGDDGALIGCSGNSVLAPGIYISSTDSSIGIKGVLTLDGQGDENAKFVFQSPSSTLITAAGASGFPLCEIKMINGTKASNIWWQVGSSATIGAYSIFNGNILADSSITMETGATSCGRLLAGGFTTSGAFVFDSNTVSVPGNGCPL